MIDLSTKELIGKDIRVFLKILLVTENQPRLVGRSIIYGNEKTKNKRGVFTSCTNKCPPWSIKSDEIIHNSQKKKFIIIKLG